MDPHLQTVNVYNQHVQEYVSKFMDLNLYQDTFDPLLQRVPLNGSVLELGCGPGNVVKYLKSKREDLHIYGIDLAPAMITEAKRQNPGSKFEVMDLRHAARIEQRFDAVIAAFCLPYISYDDVPALFTAFGKLTAGNGLLYISCMEGNRERSGFEKTSFTGDDEMYINYYGRNEIRSLLEKHNFDIEAFYTKDYPEEDGSVTIDFFYVARKRNVR